MKTRLVLVVLLAFILGACSSAGPQPQANSPTAPAVTAQPQSTATSTLEPPTETPVPPTATNTPTPTATPEPRAYGPDNFPENVNPLTGLVVGDVTRLERRPVAVKVQMFPRGQRPPYGVSLADIVYDYYQNAGATRLTAIFYGQDAERVSPIRSGRLLDYHLVDMFEAVFAFGSADQRILNRLTNSPFADRLFINSSESCPPNPMCRVDPNGFNYLITDTKLFSEYVTSRGVDNSRQELNGMRFDPEPPSGGQPGVQATVRYNLSNYNRWDYDPETGRYLRFQDAANDDGQGETYEPLVDGLNEEQIAADNVVILFVTHGYAFNTRGGNSEIIDIQLTGSGTAYAFRDGQVYLLRWNRATREDLVTLTFPDGTPYALKPGNSWYQVVGQYSQATSDAGDAWRFTFSIP